MGNPEILNIGGSVVPVISGSHKSEISGNLNVRNLRYKENFNKLINGVLPRSVVGEAPETAYTSQDLTIVTSSDPGITGQFVKVYGSSSIGNPSVLFVTGGLFPVTSSIFTYPDQMATPPSWTQNQIGKRHSFVLTPLSSSDHEISRLNTFLSGQLPLESSPVPASASAYYSKSRRFVHRVYKLSASLDLPVVPADLERFPFDQEIAGRPIFDPTSGSFRSYSIFNPAVFEIDVPDYGRIRDIKVWVELIHDVRMGTGTIGSSSAVADMGLQSVQVALRSPNVVFRAAHPLWNDPQTFRFNFRPSGFFPYTSLTGAAQQFNDNRYLKLPELLKSSYILWQGHAMDGDDLNDTLTDFNPFYVSWDSDIDMRTVFTDSSPEPNPRHLDALFPNATDTSPGLPAFTGSAVSLLSGALSGGAPNNKAFSISADACLFGDSGPSARGKHAPWFIDQRIGTGSLRSGAALGNVIGMSPPPGWLTGPGGTPAAGEFPTTGSNLGPNTIKPVWPLLDDCFVEKIYDETPDTGREAFAFPKDNHPKIIGFRPGLRGTEIHGKWQLLVGVRAYFDQFDGYVAAPRAGIWFRQFRLEFLVDEGPESNAFTPSSAYRFKRPAYVPQRPGRRRVQILSGTASWDIGVNYSYTSVRQEYGRSIGITDNTGSSVDSFAVFSRITGSLADYLTGSVLTQGVFQTFLNNEFGTPFIPISSGSGIPPSFETFDETTARATREVISTVIHPGPVIHQQDTITNFVARNNLLTSKTDLVAEIVRKTREALRVL